MKGKGTQVLVEKVPTGIAGFDHISQGGIPKGRSTLVSGTSGSAKTIFACQFLIEGARLGEGCVFVTFEESVEDLRRNVYGFGWDIAALEREGKWAFVDVSSDPDSSMVVTGDFDLGALLARIEYAVQKVNAKRVSLDSIGSLFNHFDDARIIRNELLRVFAALKNLGVTAIVTAERTQEYGAIARYGVEEFVSDNVIILRNILAREKRRRTVEVLKFRGTGHNKGEYPFSIATNRGIVMIPLSALSLQQSSSAVRATSGNDILDEMCGGGYFRDSIVLVSGATGTGKTLLATSFLAGGVAEGERGLFLAFEESQGQLFRNAQGWNFDIATMEREGMLKVMCTYPEVAGLEDHLIIIKEVLETFKPKRIAIDSFSALERTNSVKDFREFVIGLTSLMKNLEITGLFTATTSALFGGTSVIEAHISTITDTVILLRYVELFGEIHRGLTVLKMRGSAHDKSIRKFDIDSTGLHIRSPFRNVTGILTGMASHNNPNEFDRLGEMFQDDVLPEPDDPNI